MNRREFFKLTGLGAGAAFLVPTVLGAAWTDQWKAEDAVQFAVSHAQALGASYADATVGNCEIVGHTVAFAPLGLLESDLLGMRVCTPIGWRKLVMRDFAKAAIEQNLQSAFDPRMALQPERNHWLVAQFCKEKVLAHASSDAATERNLNTAMLRYGQQLQMPENRADLLFCDILLHQ